VCEFSRIGVHVVVQVFQDLDEIVARFVHPMAQNARDIINHSYFVEPPIEQTASDGGAERLPPLENFEFIEQRLYAEKTDNPKRIPYMLSPTHRQVGKFMLSYMPGIHARHEYITVTHHGYRFRYRSNEREFPTLTSLFNWFKAHYNEPVAGMKDPIEAEKARLQELALRDQQQSLGHEPSPFVHSVPDSVRSENTDTADVQRQRAQRRDVGATPACQTPAYEAPGSRYMKVKNDNGSPSHQTPALALLEEDMYATVAGGHIAVNDGWKQQTSPQLPDGAPTSQPAAHFGARTNWPPDAKPWMHKQNS
jgi:hypothetical protein